MACSVAVAAASPVFSSQRTISLVCKQSPDTLALQHDLHLPGGSPSANSPSSPYRLRLGGTNLRLVFSDDCSPLSKDTSSPSEPGTSAALKRKRPGRIHIPAVEPLDFASISSRGDEEVESDSSRFAVFCKRGRRRIELEDRYKVSSDGDSQTVGFRFLFLRELCVNRSVLPFQAFFGVFDGHGGTAAVDFAANNLDRHILVEIKDHRFEEGVRSGYLKTDEEFLEKKATGGVSCVTALIVNGDLIVSNAGDCRAVMSSDGVAEALTSDHRPSREDERIRIEKLVSITWLPKIQHKPPPPPPPPQHPKIT